MDDDVNATRALAAGALIATSGEQTSLFIAPPLISEEQDLARSVAGLGLADADYGATARAASRFSARQRLDVA
jgi:hypothetical protein